LHLLNTEYINKDIKLFIDSIFINNKYGVEDMSDAKLTLLKDLTLIIKRKEHQSYQLFVMKINLFYNNK
jgi:hypothetical protein